MSSRSRNKSRRPPPPPSSQARAKAAEAAATRASATARKPQGPLRKSSAPKIVLGEAIAGRETLAAIADELRPSPRPRLSTMAYGDRISNAPGAHTPSRAPLLTRPSAASRAAIVSDGPSANEPSGLESFPEISVHERIAGRETLAAIAEEQAPGVRERQNTRGYEEPDSVPKARSIETSLPDISVRETIAGRETLAAIGEELARVSAQNRGVSEPTLPADAAAPASGSSAEAAAKTSDIEQTLDALEVFEMVTFVVRGDITRLSSHQARLSFVERRLLHRLPIKDMAQVDRVDVTPWTVQGNVILRVWCRVPPPL